MTSALFQEVFDECKTESDLNNVFYSILLGKTDSEVEIIFDDLQNEMSRAFRRIMKNLDRMS